MPRGSLCGPDSRRPGPQPGLVSAELSERGPAHDLIQTYVRAFNKRQFLREARCFAGSYFEAQGVRGADFVADMNKRYPEDGYWARALLKLDAKLTEDGQTAKGYFLHQLTGHHEVTRRNGLRGHDMRHEFSRTDFEARKGLTGWQFTTFETKPSADARRIRMDRTLKILRDSLARPKLSQRDRAKRLADVAFFYIQYDDWRKAEDYARQSIGVQPTWLGHSCLARALQEQGQYDDAIEHYQKAALAPGCCTPAKDTREYIRECKVLKEEAMGE